MNKRVLVFGVSGVGKSTLCKAVVKKVSGFARLSIGELLSEELFFERGAGRDAVLRRQRKMPPLINRRASIQNFTLLLEGHPIVSSEVGPVRVPTEVVAQLQPAALLMLYAKPDVILARQIRRGDRINSFRYEKIQYRQSAIMGQTMAYAKQLALPMLSVNITSKREVSSEILTLLRQ